MGTRKLLDLGYNTTAMMGDPSELHLRRTCNAGKITTLKPYSVSIILASCMQNDRLFKCLLPLAVLLHGLQLPWDTTAWLMHLAMHAFPYVCVSFAQTGAYSSPQPQVSTARSMTKSATYLIHTHKQCRI